MMKCRVAFFFVTIAALIGLATAQKSEIGSPSTKASVDPLKSAPRPLTPKSAIALPRKSSVAVPQISTSSRNTSVELTRLERQSLKTIGSKTGSTGVSKVNPVKPAGTSSASGSGINASYHKPRVSQKN